jgi:hypothetical protein
MSYQPAPQRKSKALPILLGVVIGALLLCGVGVAMAAARTDSPGGALGQAAGTAATGAADKAKPAPAAKPKGLTEGTWEVPGEVKPGTYTTTADGSCYWARLAAFDGELGSILSNGNLNPGQRGRLTVKASDKGVELRGDCTWTRAK